SKDQTAVNDLPPGLTAEDMNRYCEQWTAAHVLPRVPLVHGFCFGVTREAIDRIGFFDEDSFPNGYGEENDFCFRAVDAGFGLVVATHTYIFHAKSKSYVGPERVELMKAGSEALRRLHGRARIQRSVRSMEENPIFVNLRQRAWSLTKCGSRPNNLIISPPAGDGPTETASHPATAAVPESNSGKSATTINLAGYDFLDFGCGAGGSIELGRIRFGGHRGLGLDIKPGKVAAAREAGYDAQVCDVTSLTSHPDSVRFVLLSHFLEHLPSLADAKRCLFAACMAAREFVYVCQPYFDADGYLFDKGLKLYWSDWTGHPNRMTSLELYCCIRDIASSVPIQQFAIYRRGKITDSHETVIHALASPVDQHDWQATTHPEKPPTPFNYPVYKELGALIVLDGHFNELERRAMLKDKLFDSTN
ncbi:MAG: methyltransferase domain-containing protein, partial [Proteobacteria bacterium]|nr:methyltransferase domain-containing protein [Pseudomonadota bacterium]